MTEALSKCSNSTSRSGIAPEWPARIQAVAFDLDGLMLNTEDLYFQVGCRILEKRGKTFRNEVRRKMMGLPAQKAFELMIAEESLHDNWLDLQRESDEIFEEILATQVAPMPGLLALLDQLDQAKTPRCVATSSRKAFAEKALGYVDVLPRVDFIVTAEHVERGKPFPDIYLLAAERMGVSPSSMLVLEDSGHGTRAGVTAGACVIAVPGPHSADQDFSGAFHVACRLDDPRVLELVKPTI
jgi:HAD superfamily hydrolase (TIGR01509 family)